MNSDPMLQTATTNQDAHEWPDHPGHEASTLLFFTRMEERKASPEYQRELSELLTRRFREFFP